MSEALHVVSLGQSNEYGAAEKHEGARNKRRESCAIFDDGPSGGGVG